MATSIAFGAGCASYGIGFRSEKREATISSNSSYVLEDLSVTLMLDARMVVNLHQYAEKSEQLCRG